MMFITIQKIPFIYIAFIIFIDCIGFEARDVDMNKLLRLLRVYPAVPPWNPSLTIRHTLRS